MAALRDPRPAPAERGRVLVADDQHAVRESLRLLLRSNGYDVEDGRVPAAVLRRSRPSASTCC